VVLLSLLLLVPLPGWKFTVSARAIVRDFIETDPPADLTETHKELALRFDQYLDQNQKRLNFLYGIFAAGSALLPSRSAPGYSLSRKGSDATTSRRRPAKSAAATTRSRAAEAGPGAVSA
jgi:hypothetical protein